MAKKELPPATNRRDYRNAANVRLPGVTTITGTEEKFELHGWYWNLGYQGIEVKDYLDPLARIGTLAHAIALEHLGGQKPDFESYTAHELDLAQNCALGFFEWEKFHKLEPWRVETPCVSEELQCGGTMDFHGLVDGVETVLDLKTGKRIYVNEAGTQLGGYAAILNDLGHHVKQGMIIRIPRTQDEGFEAKTYSDLTLYGQKFLALKRVYDLNKELRKGE